MNTQVQGKQIIIIAGPNGAEYLSGESGCSVFVNADLIAEGLSPLQPADVPFCAGRLMLEQIKDHTRAGKSLVFETMLAGRSYIQMIRQWRTDGYTVKLVFPGVG